MRASRKRRRKMIRAFCHVRRGEGNRKAVELEPPAVVLPLSETTSTLLSILDFSSFDILRN